MNDDSFRKFSLCCWALSFAGLFGLGVMIFVDMYRMPYTPPTNPAYDMGNFWVALGATLIIYYPLQLILETIRAWSDLAGKRVSGIFPLIIIGFVWFIVLKEKGIIPKSASEIAEEAQKEQQEFETEKEEARRRFSASPTDSDSVIQWEIKWRKDHNWPPMKEPVQSNNSTTQSVSPAPLSPYPKINRPLTTEEHNKRFQELQRLMEENRKLREGN